MGAGVGKNVGWGEPVGTGVGEIVGSSVGHGEGVGSASAAGRYDPSAENLVVRQEDMMVATPRDARNVVAERDALNRQRNNGFMEISRIV
ncbi:hypothetical protein EBZ80_17635 [bacterium]|nr:hypothetical protein [bacterium]